MKSSIATLLVVVCTATLCAHAKESTNRDHYDGLYAGIEYGSQNIFGGAFLNEIDILAQDSSSVIGLLIGWRNQFPGRFILGVEGQYGFVDGGLHLQDPNADLDIRYDNDEQISIGVTTGVALGKNRRWHLFGYLLSTRREFDISIRLEDLTFHQNDRQNFLRYGIGAEYQSKSGISLRATLGAVRVDYGNKVTNIDVDNKVDLNLGVLYQF